MEVGQIITRRETYDLPSLGPVRDIATNVLCQQLTT
jgi:hypothetical protein